MDQLDNSDDEDNFLDDNEDEDEERLGDDEEVRSDDDDDDIDVVLVRENDGARENGRVEEDQANRAEENQRPLNDNMAFNVNENIDEEPAREGRQETIFSGINTRGMRVPLQANYDIRAIDHLLVLVSRTVRYCNTYEQIIDELKWVKASYRYINLPTTKPALWEVLGRHDENLRYLLFCSKCKDRIGTADVVENVCRCGTCGPGLDRTNIATFVHIGLTPQLQDLLKTPNIADALTYRDRRIKKKP
ncbi:uncharacterized protein LOC127282323 [Leptopilina boulardi]|uniref:uncharacterized protein LOC127282323 n=1 Tax=Leptopilina boulardi TaxID=63433 RepID=UPI0021F6676E|nr:uncharacterized protein LOC127282323 [Leptopilina boulardi]